MSFFKEGSMVVKIAKIMYSIADITCSILIVIFASYLITFCSKNFSSLVKISEALISKQIAVDNITISAHTVDK